MMTDDQQLLNRYLESGSEDAFARLLDRYLWFVWAIARRITQDSLAADDVTQDVFLLLAKKAPSLEQHPSIRGWLYRTVYFQALNVRRAEGRRKQTEQNAFETLMPHTDSSLNVWQQVEPHLDQCLISLKKGERDLILMRFFQNMKWSEIAQEEQTTEGAVKMRFKRTLEKLRHLLIGRGLSVSSLALLVEAMEAYARQECDADRVGILSKRILHSMPRPTTENYFENWNPGRLAFLTSIVGGAILLLCGPWKTFHPSDNRLAEPATADTSRAHYSPQDSTYQKLLSRVAQRSVPDNNLKEAEEALVRALYDRESLHPLSLRAVESAIGLFGDHGELAVPILLEALQTPLPQEGNRHQVVSDGYSIGKEHSLALHGLFLLGPMATPALPFLLDQINRDHVYEHNRYITVIRAMEPGPEITARLVDAMDTRYFTQNVMGWELAELIGELAPQDGIHLEQTIQTLDDYLLTGGQNLRATAAYTMALLVDEPSKLLLDELGANLQSDKFSDSPPKIYDNQGFMRAIMDHTAHQGDQRGRQRMAILGLGALGSASFEFIDAMKDIAISASYSPTREIALQSLQQISPDLLTNFDPLAQFVGDQKEGKHLNALIQEGEASPQQLMDGLVWPSSREAAAKKLGQIGAEADWALDSLVAALKNPENGANAMVAEAIARIDPKSLLIGLESGNQHVVSSVALELAKLGSEAIWAYFALETAREHMSDNTHSVDTAMRRIAPERFTPITTYNILSASVDLYVESQSSARIKEHAELWNLLLQYGPRLSALTGTGVQLLVDEVHAVDRQFATSLKQRIVANYPEWKGPNAEHFGHAQER